jgi:hypothetical protein
VRRPSVTSWLVVSARHFVRKSESKSTTYYFILLVFITTFPHPSTVGLREVTLKTSKCGHDYCEECLRIKLDNRAYLVCVVSIPHKGTCEKFRLSGSRLEGPPASPPSSYRWEHIGTAVISTKKHDQ